MMEDELETGLEAKNVLGSVARIQIDENAKQARSMDKNSSGR